MTPSAAPHEHFIHLKKILEDKMKNIDSASCRGEYKLAVYEQYALPSMHFHISVHTLHKVHLDALDCQDLHKEVAELSVQRSHRCWPLPPQHSTTFKPLVTRTHE